MSAYLKSSSTWGDGDSQSEGAEPPVGGSSEKMLYLESREDTKRKLKRTASLRSGVKRRGRKEWGKKKQQPNSKEFQQQQEYLIFLNNTGPPRQHHGHNTGL